jgi:hypothetical protein
MTGTNEKDDQSPTLRELKKISKILLLANAKVIETELSKIAGSDVRKKMWVLIDGKRAAKDIAKDACVTQMAVSYFLTSASAAEFVEYNKGEPPRRILDYIPPSWIDLVVKEKDLEGLEKDTAQTKTGSEKGENAQEAKT